MHRIARVLAVAVLSSFALVPAARAGVDLGLKAGIATSQLGSDLADLKWRSGVGAGASLAFGLTPNLSFAPELLWIRKGSTFTSTDVVVGGIDFGTIKTGIDLDYVEIPVLFRLHSANPGPVKLMLEAGPSVAFKISEKIGTSGLLDASLESDEIESFDWGVIGGVGLLANAGGLKWTVEVRYDQGLADVSKLPFGGDLKNGSVQALAGIEIPLLGH